jgi:type VII secretion effector (TIGR04197 family)
MDKIKVDATVVQGKAEQVASGATLFRIKSLSPVDNESTISANEAVKQSHKECQSVGSQLGKALMQESKNIKSLGIRFEEFDKMVGDSFKSMS